MGKSSFIQLSYMRKDNILSSLKDSNQVFIIDSLRRLVKRQTPKGHPSQLQIAQRFGCKQFTGLFALRVAPSSAILRICFSKTQREALIWIKTKNTIFRWCFYI